MSTILQEAALLRRSGNVRRCHRHQIIGEYNVAIHSYNALTLLLLLEPSPSLNLVRAVLWHDAGERELGDLPATAKWMAPALAQTYEALEDQFIQQKHPVLATCLHKLTPLERRLLKFCDGVELVMWCADQVHLGNREEPVELAMRVLRHMEEQVYEENYPDNAREIFMELWSRFHKLEGWRHE